MILRRVYHPRTLTTLRHSSLHPSILVCHYSKKSSPSPSPSPSSSSSSSSPSSASSSFNPSFHSSSLSSNNTTNSSTSASSDNSSVSPPPSQIDPTVNNTNININTTTENSPSPSLSPYPSPTDINFDPAVQFPNTPPPPFLDTPNFYPPLYNPFQNNFINNNNDNPQILPFPPFPPDFLTNQSPNPWLYPYSIPPPPPNVLQTENSSSSSSYSSSSSVSPPLSESVALAFAFINAGSKLSSQNKFSSSDKSENHSPSSSTKEDVTPIDHDELFKMTLKLSSNGSINRETTEMTEQPQQENKSDDNSKDILRPAPRTVVKSAELPPKLPAKYAILLQRLCKQNDVEGCDKLLNTIAEKGVQLDVPTFNMLISNACSIPNPSRALSFLSSMREKGLHPSPSTSLSLLYLFVATDNHPAALEHLQTMREHFARVSEGDLCDFMQKAKEKWALSQCVELLREAIFGGMEPYKSCRLLVDHSIALKDWASADELVALMLSPALTIKSAQLFFGNLLCAHAREGNMEQVMNLLEKIHSHKLTLDGKHYVDFMEAVQPPHDFFSLSLLYKDMLSHNVRPFSGVYPLLIQAASESKKNYEVADYYNKYLELGGRKLTKEMVCEVVKSLAFVNDGEKCWELICDKKDIILTAPKTLTTAFNFFKKNNNTLMCSRIFSILSKTSLPTMVNLLDAGLPILIEMAENGNNEMKKELDDALEAHSNKLANLSPDTTKQIENYLKKRVINKRKM